MYDIKLYDKNIQSGDRLLYYDTNNNIARCIFTVLDVNIGSLVMEIDSICIYDNYYRNAFWKYHHVYH